MRTFQLRTYHLRTEEAAAEYLPHWIRHIQSLALFGVETHGFFAAPSVPKDVVALISFGEGADPDKVTQEYMQSDAFKQDMSGFDVTLIEAVDTLLLKPSQGSPLF